MAQVANLQIKITEGENAVHAAGSRSSRPLTVEITDEGGRPVPGAAVSFRLPDGPGGVFASGLRSELVISDSAGRASVRNLQVNGPAGPFQILITAAKEQARAGTVSRQFIAAGSSARAPAVVRKSGKKWMVAAAIAAGIAGGLAASMAGRSAPAPKPVAAPTVTIGPPVITIGRP